MVTRRQIHGYKATDSWLQGDRFMVLGDSVLQCLLIPIIGKDMDNYLVIKDNTLINSSYVLNLNEKRLINFCVAVAQMTNTPINNNDYITVHAEDFATMFQIDSKLVYTALKTACDTILKRVFSYSYITPRGNKGVKKSNWLQSVDYIDGEGKVKVLFTKELIPFISELERNFTKYHIRDTAKMTSVYAIRLYELIIAWRSCHKTPIFEIEEFRNKLGVESTEYSRMTDFKKRVLDVAVEQINELSNIRIKVIQHKKGRSISGFSFTFVEIETKPKERDPNTIDWVQQDQKPKREKMTINSIVMRHPTETIGKTEPEIYKMFSKNYHII